MKLFSLTVLLFLTLLTCVGTSRRVSKASAAIDTWTPSNRIADVAFWYRADRYTFSDNGTTPSTNGGKVQQWNSMTGDINRAQRDNATTHSPLWKTGVQNGMPGVFFNGAMWFRSVSDLGSPFLGTIYAVAWLTNAVAGGKAAWMHGDTADADSQILYFDLGPGPIIFCEYGANGGAVSCPSTSANIANETTIGTGERFAANLHVVWKNGASAGTNTTSSSVSGSYEGMYVGCNEGVAEFFQGYIFEIVGVTTVDTEAQRLQMHNYLDRIWAIPGYPP